MIKKFKTKLIFSKNISSSVKLICFEKPNEFEFKPGQYVSVIFFFNGKTIARSYSIASAPSSDHLELCVKRIEGGPASNYLWNLPNNSEVELMGPMGSFTLKDQSKDLIFVSVGAGLAPFRSMINQLLSENFSKKIILIKGARHDEDTLFTKEFEKLSEKHSNLKVYDILSQPKRVGYKNKGYVQDFLKEYISKDFSGHVYICGLKVMIFAVEETLIKLGFKKEQIFYEKYD